MALAPGTRLGAYQILSPLGAGGMGEVYRARDTRLGRDVAIKILPPSVASSGDHAARLDREARTVAGLNHPNLVTVFSVEDGDGFHFLTMELVEGETLTRIIAPGGLPLTQMLDIAIATADALVAVHEKGVVHRDLKPGNIMLANDGRVKVLDFGLARADSETGSALDETLAFTSRAEVVGTAPYMAPEQIRGLPVDARADLFSFGVILYELASGRRPFRGATYADVTSSILRDEPTGLAHLRPDLPADLVEVVVRCLDKEPEGRFAGALEVCNELRRLRSLLEHGVRLTPVPVPTEVASIAVLPFVNRSPDKEDEYFSDGLADELLNTLVKIRSVRVAARTSSFQFRDTTEDVTAIGRKLRVESLLEGSVRKAGNRVRISVRLVKAANGYQIWSGTYEHTLDDIFAIQDEIANCVVRELRTALLGEGSAETASTGVSAEVAQAARGRATSVEAHRLYLQARHLLSRGSREDVFRATEYLERALALDPRFARGWVELSTAYGVPAAFGWVPTAAGYGRARAAVERGLELEPDLAEGHARIARIRMSYDRDWKGAEASFARALKLAPGSASVLVGASVLMQTLGRFEEAIALAKQGLDQDPVSSAAYTVLGLTFDAAGRLAEAESAYRDALDLSPQRMNVRAYLALVLLDQGREKEALTMAQEEVDEGYRLWALAIIHAAGGRPGASDEALRALTEKYAGDAAFQIAEVHAIRGEADTAFEWLDRAYEQHDGGLTELKVRRSLRSLHSDPRWPVILKRMGFETQAGR
ncbi:MAG TPA: protein kinase [Candidatus Eisenbacteria bacterium]|nr:protein kinase [Candidatus Eisenbacteria bacterium]